MATGFSITAAGAATAATAKTVINLISHATKVPTLVAVDITFDGVTASNVPAVVELCGSTQGAAGTPGSSPTPLLLRGEPTEVAVCTAGINYSAEPTTLVVLKAWFISPTAGVLQQLPLGREVTGTGASPSARKGLALRVTAPNGVNYKANFEFEE